MIPKKQATQILIKERSATGQLPDTTGSKRHDP